MSQNFLQVKRLEGYGLTDLPQFKSEFASGMDLVANFLETDKNKETKIPGSGRKIISTGIAIQLPLNCEGQIRSRSGLAINKGIFVLNSPGTIDQDFRGHLRIILANFDSEDYLVKQGDRIAQLVISNIVRPKIKLVKSLGSTKRGIRGFGSTGFS